MAKKKQAPKPLISDSTKKKIKDNLKTYKKADIERLSKKSQQYYNYLKAIDKKKREASRAEIAKSITIDKKQYRGKLAETVRKAAKFKKTSVKEHIKRNKETIVNLANKGYDRRTKTPDQSIDLIHYSKRSKASINDGNGIIKYTKGEAIKELSLLQNWAKSNADIVYMAIRRDVYLNGDIIFHMPTSELFLTIKDKDEIKQLLENFGIEYIISDPKKKKQSKTSKKKK